MKKLLLSAFTIGSFSIAIAQHTCISPVTNYTISNDPRDMIKNDFNGDGYTDVATANPNNNNVCVLLGNGAGGFAPADSFPVNSSYPQGLTSADFNNDGKPDIVTANNSGNCISLLLNVGAGTFSTAITFSTTSSGPTAATSGDFNGDGNKDVATANGTSGDVSVYLGTGAGSFNPAINFPAGSNPWYITSGDFNGDTKADLAVVNQGANNVSILIGNGTGNFSAPTNFTVGTDPRRICAADLNGDGIIDLAVANYGSSDISVLIGTGTGTFNAAVSYPAGGGLYVVTSADMNGDGFLDLAAGDASLSRIYVFEGFGNGTFATPIMFQLGSPSSVYGLVAADFNSDTHTDLATACSSANTVGMYLNNPSFVLSIAGQSAICNGNSVTLTASGATTYTWSANAGSATGYTVMLSPSVNDTYTVTGINGLCQASDTFHVVVNPIPSIFTTPNDVTCYGLCNGSTSATGSCISYTWSTGANTAGINSLCPGTYTVTGTDVNGCMNTVTSPISQPTGPLIAGVTNIVNATCVGVNNGGADEATTGGTPGYTYLWSCGSTTSTISGYGPGLYYLIATDMQSCVDTVFFNIIAINPSPTVTISGPATLCQKQTGQLTYTATGGTLPYTKDWFDFKTSSSFCSLDTSLITPQTPGADSVVLTLTDATGCIGKDTIVISVSPGDSLSGTVIEPNLSPVNSGQVYLFQQKTNNVGVLDTIGVTAIYPNGTYNFKNVWYGDYFIKIIADTNIGFYPTSIPTYYSNKLYPFQWDSALAVNHYTCAGGNDGGRNVTILEITPLVGPGVISGIITAGIGYGQRTGPGANVMGAPLKGVDVKLGKNPGGSPAARTTTDPTTGQYTFTNVPLNQAFRIYVDIPNYGMDSVRDVTLTAIDTVSDQNNYYVDSTMVRVDTASGVGIITFKNNTSSVLLYPNPASDKIYVATSGTDKVEITLFDMTGGEVKKEILQNRSSFDISNLSEGIYFVKVKTAEGIITKKIVVQR